MGASGLGWVDMGGHEGEGMEQSETEQHGTGLDHPIIKQLVSYMDAQPGANHCGCRLCNPTAWWMVLCAKCGNKRCPHATDHRLCCTWSNEPGQAGSVFA